MASPQKGKGGGSKNEDRVYAPSKNIKEAVLKAIGKDIVTACQWITTSGTSPSENLRHEIEGRPETRKPPIRIEALLPRPDADPAVICKKPQCTHFVFIDDRPVSCARGTLKQVLSLYKSYVKSALPSASNISDPFIYLNLRCPPGSYDPNIEPAKDDVLFFNTNEILTAVEWVLKNVYGELETSSGGSGGTRERARSKVAEKAKNDGGFNLLLAKKRDPVATAAAAAAIESHPPHLNLPDMDEEEEGLAARRQMDIEEGNFVPFAAPTKPSIQDLPPQGHRGRPPMFTITDTFPPGAKETAQVPQSSTSPPPPPLSPVVQRPVRKPTNWGFNMSEGYDDYDDSGDGGGGDPRLREAEAVVDTDLFEDMGGMEDDEGGTRDISISNPWTMAKMNSPIVYTAPSSSSPCVATAKRGAFRPPTRIQPPRDIRSSPPSPPPPPLRYSTSAPKSGPRRITTTFPTPGASSSSPVVPQGNPVVMEGWINRNPRQSEKIRATEPIPLQARGEYTNEGYGDDDEEEELQRRPARERRSKIVRSIVVGDKSKRRRLNEPEDVRDRQPLPQGYDEVETLPAPYRSPHKNRFLKAAAALSSQPEPRSEPEPEPEPEPELEPEPEPEPGIPPPRPMRRRTKSMQAEPEKELQIKQFIKVEPCSTDLLITKHKLLWHSDLYNRVSVSGQLAVERAIQGTVGLSFELGGLKEQEAQVADLARRWLVDNAKKKEEGIGEESLLIEYEVQEEEVQEDATQVDATQVDGAREGAEEADEQKQIPKQMRVLVITAKIGGGGGDYDDVDLI